MSDLSHDELDKLLAESGGAQTADSGSADAALTPEALLGLSTALQAGWDALAANMNKSLDAPVSIVFDVGVNTTGAAVEGDADGYGAFVHFDATVAGAKAVHGMLLEGAEVAKLAAKIAGEDGDESLTAESLNAFAEFLGMSLPMVAKALGGSAEFGEVTGMNVADPDTELSLESVGLADPLVRMEYTLSAGEDITCPMLYVLPLTHAQALAAQAPALDLTGAAKPASSGGSTSPTFGEFDAHGGGAGDLPENIELIMDIQLQVVARLGRVEMPIRDILKLGPGSIIDIDRPADGPVDLIVNDKLVARGDVVVVHENFGLKVTEVQSAQERIASLR